MKWLYSLGLSLICALFISFSLFSIPNISLAANEYKIEINKRTNKLYLYQKDKVIKTYSVATGKEENLTPEGVFKIGPRVKYPQWYNSEEKKTIPGWKEDYPKEKQENPLGPRWMGLIVNGDSGNTYGIHGTNVESSIGHHVSKGCIRMHVKDVIELFDTIKIPTGTQVWIHSGTSNQVWMNGDSIKDVKPITARVQITDRINIRQNPSTVSKILGKAEKNAQYNITGETKDWYRIHFNGTQVGFISKMYAKLITETPAPDPKPDVENPTTTSIDPKISFTKSGELKIESTLNNVKKASGTWKITLNGKVIAEEKKDQATFIFTHKNPTLVNKQINIKVEFTGQADNKQIKGTGNKIFTKTNAAMHIKPSFKENKLHIEASLKSNQDAFGIWTVQLGKTKKVYLQSGEKVTAIFDSVTFNKQKFPAKVAFKGFTAKAYITANYTKDLDLKIPEANNDQPTETEPTPEETDQESKPEEPENQETADNESTQENLKGSQEQNTTTPEKQPVVINDSGEQTVKEEEEEEEDNKVAKVEDQDQNTNINEQTNNQQSSNNVTPEDTANDQVGGQLPKTNTSYPIGILLGVSCFVIGLICLRRKLNV